MLKPSRILWILPLCAVVLAWLLANPPGRSTGRASDPSGSGGRGSPEGPVLLGRGSVEDPGPGQANAPSAVPTVEAVDGVRPVLGPHLFGRPIRVRILDAETGTALSDVTWDVEIAVTQGGWGFVIVVEAPPGFVAWGGFHVAPEDDGGASLWTVVQPLRREVRGTVYLRHEDGRRVENGRLSWQVGNDTYDDTVYVSDVSNVVALDGIPFFPGAPLEIEALCDGAVGSASVPIPKNPRALVEVEIVLRTPPPARSDGVPASASDTGTPPAGDLPPADPFADAKRPPRSQGAIEVLVHRRDGSLAPHARVVLKSRPGGAWLTTRSAETTELGRANFTKVPVGDYWVSVKEPGIVPTSREITVSEGKTKSVVIREQNGATLDVTVVGEDGRPLPFATVSLVQPSRVRWLDLRDGDLRIDGFTDERGWRQFDHVEPGAVEVRAQWASWHGSRLVDAPEDGTASIRIVLR